MTHFVRAACAALAFQCVFVPVLVAQQVSAFANAPVASPSVTDRPADPAPKTPRSGPTLESARAGVAAPAVANDTKTAAAAASGSLGKGQNVALMAVGGIALLTGLIIGGDGGTLIAVGGAVVGLYGLYNYIK